MSGRSSAFSSAANSASSRYSCGELGGGCDLDHLGIAERALGERREPAQRLDLVAEQVDAHGPVLGRREQVEQAAADRELAAVLHLVDAFVAGRHEVGRGLVEIHQVPGAQREAVRAQRRVRDLLRQCDGADDDDRGMLAGVEQRVERRDPLADEVGRRRQVRLVGDAARGVVADRPRRQPDAQAGGELARGTVVAGDDDRRAGSVPGRSAPPAGTAAATATTNARPPPVARAAVCGSRSAWCEERAEHEAND